jgi:ElaB/YqjD/DUF883 family membrane-anchored ribosome-binding protein
MVATTYSYDFYLRGIYSSNRGARKAERRSSMQNSELTKADSSAMKKIIEQLRQLEWSEPTVMEDKDSNSMNTVSDSTNYKFTKLFADTYNNLLESAGNSTSGQAKRLISRMKHLTREQKDALESVGISISSNGKLSVKKGTVNQAATYKFKQLFGSDSDYLTEMSSIAKKIKRHASQIVKKAKASTKQDSTSNAADTSSVAAIAEIAGSVHTADLAGITTDTANTSGSASNSLIGNTVDVIL